MQTIRIIVKGRVQGVFYRQTAKEKADWLGIRGYVKNLENGDVEIVAQGTEEKLDEFVDWCWKGPEMAEVKGIVKKILGNDEKYVLFTVKHNQIP